MLCLPPLKQRPQRTDLPKVNTMSNDDKKSVLEWLEDLKASGELGSAPGYLAHIYERSSRVSVDALQQATKQAESATASNYGLVEKALNTAKDEMARRHVIEESLALWIGLRLLGSPPSKRVERWVSGLRRQALHAAKLGTGNATLTSAWIEMIEYLEVATSPLTNDN
jgi:hypothetical protein